MKDTKRLHFQKGDFAAVGIVLLLIFSVFLILGVMGTGEEASVVQVYQNGELIDEFPLSENNTCTLEGDYRNLLVIEDGFASIAESNCPGNDCVHSGKIHSSGRSIVCLPNRVEIRITGETDVDYVVG